MEQERQIHPSGGLRGCGEYFSQRAYYLGFLSLYMTEGGLGDWGIGRRGRVGRGFVHSQFLFP